MTMIPRTEKVESRGGKVRVRRGRGRGKDNKGFNSECYRQSQLRIPNSPFISKVKRERREDEGFPFISERTHRPEKERGQRERERQSFD